MPRQKAQYRRTEIRFRADDPLLAELETEARARGVELQQHIYDLLRARYLVRRGESISDLLWIPGAPPPAADPPAPANAADQATAVWLDMQDEE